MLLLHCDPLAHSAAYLARSSSSDTAQRAAAPRAARGQPPCGSVFGSVGQGTEGQSAQRRPEAGDARAGEMVFPWMFDDFAALRPLRGAAEALAARERWSPLYDVRALQATTAPVASATYYDDMYVDFECGQARPPRLPEG